jgi:hypothetical protein
MKTIRVALAAFWKQAITPSFICTRNNQFSITTTGVHPLGIGVMDAQEQDAPSALLVDNISVSWAVPQLSIVALLRVDPTLVASIHSWLRKLV